MSMFRTRVFCMMALILLLVTASATAGPLGKGIKAGLSYSMVTNSQSDIDDSDRMAGVAAGVSASYELIPGLKIQPELLYVQNGGKYGITLTGTEGQILGTGDLKWKLNYIQIPVLARLEIPVLSAVLPTLMAGPAVNYLVSSSWEVDAGSNSSDGDLDDQVKSTDLSLIFGIGMKLGAGPAGVSIDLRYVHGLNNINDVNEDVEIKNRSFQALAGFSF